MGVAGVGVPALAAEGIQVGVVALRGGGLTAGDFGDGTRRAEVVGEIVEDVAGGIAAGDARAPKENVFVRESARESGLVEPAVAYGVTVTVTLFDLTRILLWWSVRCTCIVYVPGWLRS